MKNQPKTEVKKLIKMLWSSDQHTLHSSTPTVHILSNLSEFYFRAFDLNEIDICILGGDFFDHLVDASDANLRRAEYWIREFLNKCFECNVIVRVLEGTSSHDREQPEYFEVQKPVGLDLRWVKTLSTEYFPTLGFSALYVPDNMGTKTNDEIWEDTLAVLSKDGYTSVDFIFFHGAFKYQLPPHINHNCHDEIKWQSITDQLLFAGHVHIPSELGKIRVSGSFDRIAHGEEHPKGAYYAEFDTEKRETYARFWENKKALPYVTLKVDKEIDASALSRRILDALKLNNFPPNSCIRIKGGDSGVVNPIIEQFAIEYPLLNFKAKNVKNDDQIVDEELYTDRKYDGINLNKDNISDAILQHLEDTDVLSRETFKGLDFDKEVNDYKELLAEFL